jgi:hypothetical protein
MDPSRAEKLKDRKFPGQDSFYGLAADVAIGSMGAIGFSIRTFQHAKAGRNPLFTSCISTLCLFFTMQKGEILTDLLAHQQKYPELYEIEERTNKNN